MQDEDSSTSNFVKGEELTPEDIFWIDLSRNRLKNSLQYLEETAKQYITINSFSQTIYFAAISFSEVKNSLSSFNSNTVRFLCILVLTLPLDFWIFSLIFAAQCFPHKVFYTKINSPRASHDFYISAFCHKSKYLTLAQVFLIIGFVFLVLDVFVYYLFLPSSIKG
ncbi:MAG: hypothetical protein DSM106950_04945 [Stigonema ocellatum SAG 48.90 = DSM 106950]|nr:hypothetical protein [Stigonema ocellatum SAG 48.90 = DSM 106950]